MASVQGLYFVTHWPNCNHFCGLVLDLPFKWNLQKRHSKPLHSSYGAEKSVRIKWTFITCNCLTKCYVDIAFPNWIRRNICFGLFCANKIIYVSHSVESLRMCENGCDSCYCCNITDYHHRTNANNMEGNGKVWIMFRRKSSCSLKFPLLNILNVSIKPLTVEGNP